MQESDKSKGSRWVKKSWKNKKMCPKEGTDCTWCESSINTVAEELVSSENIASW